MYPKQNLIIMENKSRREIGYWQKYWNAERYLPKTMYGRVVAGNYWIDEKVPLIKGKK